MPEVRMTPPLRRLRRGVRGTLQRQWTAPGGYRELLVLAWPLILTNSVWTLQITIDRMFLTQSGSDNVAASMIGVLLFWTPLTLFQTAANYATTFVAQYVGAGRPERVGPVVWQALYFSLVSGLGFIGLAPLADDIVALGGHSAHMQTLEATYFRCLCYAALPTLITAAVSGFFAGRGDSRTVLFINVIGLATNAVLDYAMIFGHWGFPEMGIAGAGWATVIGTAASAVVGVALFLLPRYQEKFATVSGWRPDWPLLGRLMQYGLPSGLQWSLDGLAFTVFTVLIGLLGDAELAATSITFTLNMLAFMPPMGIGQAVMILVGQRLGQNRPSLAERSTWSGFRVSWGYMALVSLLYVSVPGLFVWVFQRSDPSALDAEAARLVPGLLRFVAVYSLFESLNLIFSFALKGAGDTRFVTIASLALAWPIMVVPSWAAWNYGWGLHWAWTFASAYIIAIAWVMLWRFRAGKWKAMRVIEPAVA